MTAGSAASRRVLARTPVAPLPASSPKRPTSITGRMSAPPEMSSPEVCSFRLPQMCGFRLPLTVAFTATRWQTLLKGHPEWMGPVPSAPDCYRYCLTAPAVQVVLSAPKTSAQARENLTILGEETLGRDAVSTWESYGDLVHGDGKGAFETQWL